MEKEPFKNRTLGGRLVRDSVTTSVMLRFTCFIYARSLRVCPYMKSSEEFSQSPSLLPWFPLRVYYVRLFQAVRE